MVKWLTFGVFLVVSLTLFVQPVLAFSEVPDSGIVTPNGAVYSIAVASDGRFILEGVLAK